ncbi:MAG: hypothetical protein C0424_07240 [Sphingobacteriaceae bacterium]|nr:hypothetical protein [Sphingobacteriaceae bacterium]
MEQHNEDRQNSLANDIFPVKNYLQPSSPKERDGFQPWHKPRKQYVREKQWCQEIRELFDEHPPENNIFKYLGLPGEDLLDLRYFHDKICVPRGFKLKYLGFNNDGNSSVERGSDLHVSLHEVNRLGLVSEESAIMPDNFCKIADEKTPASKKTKHLGPFDVINIDLCDGIGKQSHEFLQTHYSTLSRIMNLQSRRKNPWLLFITTRTAGPKQIDEGVFEVLKKIYVENLEKCPSFLEASMTERSISDETSLDSVIESAKGKADVFLVSLCKWLAAMGLSLTPKVEVKVKSVFGYKVYGGEDFQDMTSLSLLITPTDSGVNDPYGLAFPSQRDVNECELAVHALRLVCSQLDVDAVLEESAELKEEMIHATGELLELARYNKGRYLEWAGQANKR